MLLDDEWFDKRIAAFEALRPDGLLLKVADSEAYFQDPRGGPTDEDPPHALPERIDTLDIDEYLGIYVATRRKIKVFNKNIEVAARELSIPPEHLRRVVHYHEQAHAVIHLGVTMKERHRAVTDAAYRQRRLRSLTSWTFRLPRQLSEHLAQLLAYHALRTLDTKLQRTVAPSLGTQLLAAFRTLMTRQSHPYRVDAFLDVPHHRLLATLGLLRSNDLRPAFEPWKTVMLLD